MSLDFADIFSSSVPSSGGLQIVPALATSAVPKEHGQMEALKQLFYKVVSWMNAPLWKPSARVNMVRQERKNLNPGAVLM
jgi:hypothetical protein